MAGSGLGEFLQQIPIIPILSLMCGFGGLVLLSVYVYTRRRNEDKTLSNAGVNVTERGSLRDAISFFTNFSEKPQPPAPSRSPASVYSEPEAMPDNPQTPIDNDDLPDLDSLLGLNKPAAQPPPPQPAARSAPSRPAQSGTYSVRLEDGGTVDVVEVMTIMRDIATGELIVQIGDSAYRDINAVRSPEFIRRFKSVMRELVKMASSLRDAPAAEQAESAPPSQPSEPVEADETPPQPAPKRRTSQTPPPPVGGAMPGDLPSYRFEDQEEVEERGFLGRTRKKLADVPELDIAGSIEAYLQHKLMHSDEYYGREIHIHSSPDGGVRIEVDDVFYEAVSDIRDDGVREFVANAIQEWQERQG